MTINDGNCTYYVERTKGVKTWCKRKAIWLVGDKTAISTRLCDRHLAPEIRDLRKMNLLPAEVHAL